MNNSPSGKGKILRMIEWRRKLQFSNRILQNAERLQRGTAQIRIGIEVGAGQKHDPVEALMRLAELEVSLG